VALGTGCTDWAGTTSTWLWAGPALSTLRRVGRLHPHQLPRLPAEGTVPVITRWATSRRRTRRPSSTASRAHALNPLPPPRGAGARRAAVYERQCWACHGVQGNGQGSVVGPGRFPFAPAIGAGAPERSEGYIYAVTDVGRGLMPAYGYRIPHARPLGGGDVRAPAAAGRPRRRRAAAAAAPGEAPTPDARPTLPRTRHGAGHGPGRFSRWPRSTRARAGLPRQP
jgi:hypothetical protein